MIYTSGDDRYLHLPGLIVAENATGDVRYLMPDGLGSIRQAVDSQGQVAVYHEFDPYGSPVENGGDPYGFTGEWWEDEVALLHLRARWYAPGVGIFLSRDQWPGTELRPQSMNGWNYVEGNPVNFTDPTGLYLWFNITTNSKWRQHWQIERWFENRPWAGFWRTHLEFNQITSGWGGQIRQDILFFPQLASGTSSPIDFNGVPTPPKGEIYEIEPLEVAKIAEGLLQLRLYERQLKASANNRQLADIINTSDAINRSTSPYSGKIWNFNQVKWAWGTTLSPGPHRVPWSGQGDIWIVRPLPGLILYVDDNMRQKAAAGTITLASLLPLARQLSRLAQTRPPVPAPAACSSFNFIYLPSGLLEGDFVRGVLDGNLKCIFGLGSCDLIPRTS